MTLQLDLTLAERPEQLPLAIPHEPDYSRAAIIEAPSLMPALRLIGSTADWPIPCALLTGPAGSGKTHFSQAWKQEVDARQLERSDLIGIDLNVVGGRPILVENADILVRGERGVAVQRALFHLVNDARTTGMPLMLTARREPNAWGVVVRDLVSRLRSVPHVRLPEPEPALMRAVLAKLFEDRQLVVPGDAQDLIVDTIERSLSAARDLVEKIDRHSLASGRPVGQRLVKRLLETASF